MTFTHVWVICEICYCGDNGTRTKKSLIGSSQRNSVTRAFLGWAKSPENPEFLTFFSTMHRKTSECQKTGPCHNSELKKIFNLFFHQYSENLGSIKVDQGIYRRSHPDQYFDSIHYFDGDWKTIRHQNNGTAICLENRYPHFEFKLKIGVDSLSRFYE